MLALFHTPNWLSLPCTLLCLLCNISLAQAQTYRIGAEDDWYPYTAYRDGKVQGMSVDIVLAAFSASHTDVELLPYPYARCMELTRTGQLAACFNTAPDAQTASEYQLPEEALFSDDILLWARRDEAWPIGSLEQLSGRSVAVTIGYEYGTRFDSSHVIERVNVRQDLNGFRMLQHGRVDFSAAYRGTANALFRAYPELAGQFVAVTTLHQPQLYLSFSRYHPQAILLRQRFDQGMQIIRSNGRYAQILEHWQHQAPAQ